MTNGLPVGLPLLCRRPIKKIIFFHYPRVSPGAAPLTKKPEDPGYEIVDEAEENSFKCPFDFEFALLWKRLNFFRREIR